MESTLDCVSVYYVEHSISSIGDKGGSTDKELSILEYTPTNSSGLQDPEDANSGIYERKYYLIHSFGQGFTAREIWLEIADQYEEYRDRIHKTLKFFSPKTITF